MTDVPGYGEVAHLCIVASLTGFAPDRECLTHASRVVRPLPDTPGHVHPCSQGDGRTGSCGTRGKAPAGVSRVREAALIVARAPHGRD